MATGMTSLSGSIAMEDAEVEMPQASGNKKQKRCIKSPQKRVILICIVTAVLAALVGFLLGYFVPRLVKDSCEVEISPVRKDVDNKFAEEVNTEELENNLR